MNCNTTATAAAGGNNNKCSAENVWTNEKKSIYSKSNDDDMSKSIINNNKEDNNNNKTVWNKIYELRSKLANDVICDPSLPSSSDDNNNNNNNNNNNRDKNDIVSSYNFPTFISPFDMSSTNSTNSKVGSGGGAVPLIYCDQTASQRPIKSIENYLRDNSMSCYANTHTNITYTGSQSTAYLSESRQIVAEATNARITGKASLDTVIFGGNGVTGVVNILIDTLNLKGIVQQANNGNSKSSNNNDDTEVMMDMRPVIFVGPHEHHSNLLPWRESGAEVITISEEPTTGMVNIAELERYLNLPKYNSSSGRLRIGAFSSVSNVTGIIANVDKLAITLHKYGALAFFDYASGAPYLKMDMNPNPIQFSNEGGNDAVDPSKDAIYFSPHKCYGGPSTPGVLIIKKHLISQINPPSVSGGGTVFYVSNTSHRFLSNRIERYEGGTPDGLGVQRVGLSLLAGRRVGREYERIVQSVVDNVESGAGDNEKCPPKTLLEYECSTYDRVVKELKEHAPNLIMLGTTVNDDDSSSSSKSSCVGRHLPIFSFLIRCGKRFLHYNYVCAVLNDVFGIQSRGGCQCAGPYSQRLLGMTTMNESNEEVPNNANKQIERALLRSDRPCELLRPGYSRLSLPFKGLREEEVDYVISALVWVAKNGWIFLPQYTCDHRTGEWRHWSRRGKPLGKSERRWLSHYDILAPTTFEKSVASQPSMNESDISDNIQASKDRLAQATNNANKILESAKNNPRFLSEAEKMNTASGMLGSGGGVDDTLEDLRWYVYQREVSQSLREGLQEVPETFVDDALLGGLDVRMDGIRRNNGDAFQSVEEVMIEVAPEGNNTTEVAPHMEDMNVDYTIESSDPIPFKEGDHAGEATYAEIKDGYDEGELSEACEVFSKARDEWLPIEDFLKEYEVENQASAAAIGRKRKSATMEETSSPSCEAIHSMKIDSTGAADTAMDTSPPTKQVSSLPPAATKREKKKPSRDSSQWGQSTVPPHIAPKSNVSSGVADSSKETSVPPPTNTKESNKSKKNKGKIKPPPKMMRFITQAMIQWDMVEEGDRLLLGLSGGKDSLSLLHCLLEFQRKLPIKFEIEVCTIDPMTPSFDPSPLIPYVEGLGLKYHYIKDDIVERAASSGKDGKTVSSLCAFCARMKRGNLYTCARENKCNKLVLAQHLDDCAESFLMSIMHNGFIRTMKANYKINAGDVSVIRPLVYCRESLMTEFAKSANLPVINENCPACFEEPKERARMKKLLSREETLYPNLYDHIRRALIPILHDDSTAIMRSYLENTIAKSRKVPVKKKAKLSNGSLKDDEESKAVVSSDNSSSDDASKSLASASEEELIAELARRRASKYQMSGAMKRLPGKDDGLPPDGTGM